MKLILSSLILFIFGLNAYSSDSIKACVYTVFLDDAQPKGVDLGIGRDLIKLLEEQMDIPIQIQVYSNLNTMFKSAKERKCDIVPVMEKTSEREEYFEFTKPYFKIPVIMATKVGMPFISDIRIIKDRPIAVVKSHSYINRLSEKYPNLNLIVVNSLEEGLRRLQTGEVFGMMGFSQMNYLLKQKNARGLAVTAQFDEYVNLSVAIRNDRPELAKIINNAYEKIPKVKLDKMIENWLSIGYEREPDYRLFVQILYFIFVIGGIFLFWNLHFRDVLEKKEQKQLIVMRQNRFAQMGEMIENIAHQWRQPLAQINSNIWLLSMLLEKEKLEDKTKIIAQIDDIERITNHMSETIDDFKSFFHPSKTKQQFALLELFDNCLLILKGALEAHHIKISFDFRKDIILENYLKELEHAIVNIINNAKEVLVARNIKNPQIRIKAIENKNQIIIEICDNGGGIDEKNIEKIFDIYFTTKLKNQNTGIGLYMAKNIVEQTLNGSLSAENRADGACFILGLKGRIQDE